MRRLQRGDQVAIAVVLTRVTGMEMGASWYNSLRLGRSHKPRAREAYLGWVLNNARFLILPCDTVFSEDEWQAIYLVTQRRPPPDEPPSLDTMVRMVATLGGFLNRKFDGFPGPKALWSFAR